MKREHPDAPLVGVGAIVVESGRVLLVKRGHPPLQGEWSVPGGVLELGETLRQGVTREVKEETGLDVEPGEILGVFDRVLRDQAGRVLYHYVLVDFLCRPAGGHLLPAGDADEAQWFTEAELDGLNLTPDTLAVIHQGFRPKS